MKILPININRINSNKQKNNNKIKEEKILNIDKKIDLLNIGDNRYLINFGANNENLQKLYETYSNGKGMPISFENYLKNMPQEQRERTKDIYNSYKFVYGEMENCHSVEELKEYFPMELGKIKSAKSEDFIKGSFLYQINEWSGLFENSGEYLFPETKDNDLTVYLAKKIYFEAKTKKEIQEDFLKDINKEILSEKDIEELKSKRSKSGSELIPESIYSKLGLTGSFNSNGFRNSLCLSRKEYIEKYGSIYKEKRKENLEKVLKEVVENLDGTEKVNPRKNKVNYEKLQYIMFYAWNNSLELRRTLSDFLIQKRMGNDLLDPDLMEIKYSKKKENQEESNLQTVMAEFWKKYPEYKTYFSGKCKEAFDVIEFTIDNGTFDVLKDDIDRKRQSLFFMLRKEKEEKENEIKEKELIKEKQEELLKRKELLRKEILKIISDLKNEMAIPNSQKATINRKITEITSRLDESHSNLDEIAQEINGMLNETYTKVKKSTMKTVNDIISLNRTFFHKKTKELYEKEYGPLSVEKINTFLYGVFEEDLNNTMLVFDIGVLEKYLIFLQNFPNAEAPRDQRKNKINELIKELKKDPNYNKMIKNKVQEGLLEELKKMLFETPPKKLMQIYQKNFDGMEVSPEELSTKYTYFIEKVS